jgi:hypothetical protein
VPIFESGDIGSVMTWFHVRVTFVDVLAVGVSPSGSPTGLSDE